MELLQDTGVVLRKGLLCWWGGRADSVRGGPSWLGPPRASCCPQVIYMARNPKDLVVSYYQFHRSLRTMSYRGTFQEFCRRFMNDKREYPCPGVPWATPASPLSVPRTLLSQCVLGRLPRPPATYSTPSLRAKQQWTQEAQRPELPLSRQPG